MNIWQQCSHEFAYTITNLDCNRANLYALSSKRFHVALGLFHDQFGLIVIQPLVEFIHNLIAQLYTYMS